MWLKCVSMLHAQKKCAIPRLHLSSSIWRPHLSNVCSLEKPSAAHQLISSSSAAALCTQRCQVVTSTYHVEEFQLMEKTQLSSKSLVLPNFQKSCSQIPRGTGRSIFFRTSQAMPNASALCPWSSCWGRLDTLVYSQQAGGQRRAVEPWIGSQCQPYEPMTKTCGSSGQTKRTAHVPNCIYARTFENFLNCSVWGHEGALVMPMQFLLSESMQPWNDSRGNDRVLWNWPLPDQGVPLTMLSAAPIRICPSHRSPSMCQYSLHFLHTKHTHWLCLRAYATSRSKFTPIGLWFGPNFHQTLHIAGSVSKFGTLKAIVSWLASLKITFEYFWDILHQFVLHLLLSHPSI